MTEAANLLWHDVMVGHRRRERSACALIAVERAVREATNLSHASGFLPLYECLARAPAEHFTRVWRDPAAYHWVRRAVQLLAEGRRRTAPSAARRAPASAVVQPADALERHLRDFARFVIGLAFVAGGQLSLATPFETALPFAIPGTRLALVGRGRVRMTRVADGRIEVARGATRRWLAPGDGTDDLRLHTCPTVAEGAVSVLLNPYLFCLPGVDILRDPSPLAPDFQQRHTDVVAQTLRLLAHLQPATLAHLDGAVVALKPAQEEDFGTLSTSELPDAFVCSVPADPVVLAADFVHEVHHNRLFAIEESGPLFEATGEDAIEGEHYYSPWRDAPRPLHGLLHAVYVYLPVHRFWAAAVRQAGLEGARLDFARDQLARIPFQVRIGIGQLSRQARFTPFGGALFEEIARAAGDMEGEAASLGATLRSPAVTCRASGALQPVLHAGNGGLLTVAETLLEHLVRCDRAGQCAQERDLLAQALGARSAGAA